MPHDIHVFDCGKRVQALFKQQGGPLFPEEIRRMSERSGVLALPLFQTTFDNVTEELWAKFEARSMDTSKAHDGCLLVFAFFTRGWNAHLEFLRQSGEDPLPDLAADRVLAEWRHEKNADAIRGYPTSPGVRRILAVIRSDLATLTASSFVALALAAFVDGWCACRATVVRPATRLR